MRQRGRAVLLMVVGGVLAGCAGAGSGFSGSGQGFGGFRGSTVPTLGEESYTQRRITGRPDEVVPLQPDTSVGWPRESLERANLFETEEERRARLPSEPRARGSATPPRPDPVTARDPADLQARVPSREPEPPPVERRGQPIPGAPPGTVTTGGTGRMGTFGGPAGSGTTVRDGGTVTLMGADGQVRTVPAPR